MVKYQRRVTWGGFLLVVGTMALLAFVPLAFPEAESLSFLLWYWLGWASLGAFAGMTVVAAKATRDRRVLWHVAVSGVTLLCLSFWHRDLDFFRSGPANWHVPCTPSHQPGTFLQEHAH